MLMDCKKYNQIIITFTCKAMFALIYYVVGWLQTTLPKAAYKFAWLQVDINPCSNQYINRFIMVNSIIYLVTTYVI